MLQNQIRYKKPFYFALVLHVFLLIFFVLNLDLFSDKPPVLESSDVIVNATVVEQRKTHTEVAKEQAVEPIKREALQEQQAQQKQQKLAEEQAHIAKMKQEKLLEQKKLEKLQTEQKLAAEKLAKLQEQHQLEQQKQQAEEKKRKELLAKKHREEVEKQLQQQLSEEAQEHTDQKQKAAQKEAQEQIEAAQAAQMQGEVDRYKALILNAIRQRWIEPEDIDKSLSSKFLIRLAPGGVVLDVRLLESSGNPELDRSARAAVFKASPLPVPGNALVFEQFREFTLTVKPG